MITIRPMLHSDAEAVCRLSEQLGYRLSVAETKRNLEEVQSLTNHIALVAIENNEVAGWVHAFKTITIESLPFIELAGLIVDERHRGKGTGKELVKEIMKWCGEQEIDTLRVRSNVVRQQAHTFYVDLGFTEIKQQKVFQLKL
jgi:GNAT superfamily N-acetyltransferase